MSAHSEPEKYSIDEMMERLKSRSEEEAIENGELVIRADGSQAIRVRKRKRRSHQPHKEQLRQSRRARMIQISGALALLLLAGIGAGTAIIFANSAPYRDNLVSQITSATGAKVDLRQFRVNPTTANSGGITLTWPEGNALQSLTTRGFIAKIAPPSFLGKSFVGDEVTAPDATLVIRYPQPGKPLRQTPETTEPVPIRFARYACPRFHVLLGDPATPPIRLMNSEASFHTVDSDARSQLLLNRGEISIKGWPNLRMDRAHIEFPGQEIDIVGMRLRQDDDSRGTMELSGSINPYTPGTPSTLAVQLESFPTTGLLGPEIGRLFSGRIDTLPAEKSNTLTISPDPEDPVAALSVAFHKSAMYGMEINGFPFLLGLARTLDDKWFERPVFENDASGVIRRSDGSIAISDINLENKDRLHVRGNLTASPNRLLSGEIEVGIPETMIQASGSRRMNAIFSPAKQGFRWVTLKISGNANNPADNFTELLDAAATEPDTPATSESPSGNIPSFEDLTRPE